MFKSNAVARVASRHAGFTLVELLTVMAIIAILMSILFPVITIIKRTAREAQARNDVREILTAIGNYQTEYGRLPMVDASAAGDVTYTSEADNGKLMDILRAIDTDKNPKRTVFLVVNDAKSSSAPVAGISSASGAWMDPWGHPYAVAIDADYDNQLANPKPGGVSPMHRPLAAWSLVYKGDIEKSGLLSWE